MRFCACVKFRKIPFRFELPWHVTNPTFRTICDIKSFDFLSLHRFSSSPHVDPYLRLLALPSRKLYAFLPGQEAMDNDRITRDQGAALLRDLSSSDTTHVPDAGIRCARCKSSNISFDFLQTRSADEGTTVYCTCTVCQKRWKM